ncbi:MAG: SET domain-containing protein [Planctomycetaceae bacterium]
MSFQPSMLIEVKQIPGKGRGVFATTFIPAGTIIEKVPMLVMPATETIFEDENNVLQHYVFEWGKGKIGLALGYGSLYNHSFSPNARYDDLSRSTKTYTALRDIPAGEEITINYNGHEDDDSPVHFDVVEAPAQEAEPVRSGTEKSTKAKSRTVRV